MNADSKRSEFIHLPKPGSFPQPANSRLTNRTGEVLPLDFRFFTRYSILRHESPADFHRLMLELHASYEPVSPAEELAVVQLTQIYWLLRRADTMEAAVYDSAIKQVRETAGDAHPAAALASTMLGFEESETELFRRRIRTQRRDLEEQAERCTNRILRLKTYREARELRMLRAQELRQRLSSRTPRAVPADAEQPRVYRIAGRNSRLASSPKPEGLGAGSP